MVTLRLLQALELDNKKTTYFEKKFSIPEECIHMVIIDEDDSYEAENLYYDAASNEVIGVITGDSTDNESEFDNMVQEMKGSGWRVIEDLPPRLESIF